MSITNILKNLPDNPGIYLYYNKAKELIYVGKATSLKDRVRSYFRGQRSPRPIESMIHEVVDIKWQETESVLEAIIAEANAIKKYQPKYNVDGKDDKSWNYITISSDEYPIVETIRQREYDALIQENKKAKKQFAYIFGPYPGLNAKATLKLLRKMFRFSTCPAFANATAGKQKEKVRPCFYYQIGLCLGVCTGEITPKEYREKVIRPLATFLSGRKKQVVKDFEKQMKTAVKREDFEEAARLRDQLFSLQRIQDIALLNKSFVSDSLGPSPGPLLKGGGGGDSTPNPTAERIEGYDISNLGATGMVGSMVVFTDGEQDKSQYRKFKIKTVEGQSDVDCLEEVLRRRLNHAEWTYPNIFLIDGGPPQVNRAKQVMDSLGITIPVVGIAKGPERKRNDVVFPSGFDATTSRELIRWIQTNFDTLIRVRDEAHRFAITYQRTLRKLP